MKYNNIFCNILKFYNTFCNTWKFCNKYYNTFIFWNKYCNTIGNLKYQSIVMILEAPIYIQVEQDECVFIEFES